MSLVMLFALAGMPAMEYLAEAPTPLVVSEDEAPTPLTMAVAELRADLAGKAATIATLESRIAALEARCNCGQTGSVAVVSAREVHGFHPLAAAVNVATWPARAAGAVCTGSSCANREQPMAAVNFPSAQFNDGWSNNSTSQSGGGGCSGKKYRRK